jgi:putative FmdB family regulatory protein
MPTYEFRCPNGHDFENFYRSIAAAPLEVRCPTCGKIAERQLSAGAGLVFKGTGFYITDYGKDGKKSQTPAPAAGESSSGAGASEGGTSAEASVAKSDSKASGESTTSAEPKSKDSPKPAPKAASSKKRGE